MVRHQISSPIGDVAVRHKAGQPRGGGPVFRGLASPSECYLSTGSGIEGRLAPLDRAGRRGRDDVVMEKLPNALALFPCHFGELYPQCPFGADESAMRALVLGEPRGHGMCDDRPPRHRRDLDELKLLPRQACGSRAWVCTVPRQRVVAHF